MKFKMKKIKNIAAIVLVVTMIASNMFVANAASVPNHNDGVDISASTSAQANLADLVNDEQYVKQQETRINASLGIQPEEVEQYRAWLSNSQKQGLFHYDNGHIKVDPVAEQIAPDGMWDEYLLRINAINELIDIGIYSFSEDTGLVSHAVECFKNPSMMKISASDTGKIMPRAEIFELGEEVHGNFQLLNTIYKSSGWVGAVDYWINKVQPNGDWDYKSLPGLVGKSFLCYYGPNHRQSVQTTEWIGNYNYGYTGHLLFSLSILYAGSAAVGGGPEKDAHDRPAINEGYNNSGSIEW